MNRRVVEIALIVALVGQVAWLMMPSEVSRHDARTFLRPTLEFVGVDKLEVVEAQGGRIGLEKVGGIWRLTDQGRYPALSHVVEGLLARIAGYAPGPVVGETPERAEECQVGQTPAIRILMASGSKQWELKIAPGPADTDYVQLGGDPKVYQLEPSLARQMSTESKRWVDPFLYRMTKFPSQFYWRIGDQEHHVRFDGRNWMCRDMMLDNGKVQEFIQNFSALPVDEPLGLSSPMMDVGGPLSLVFHCPGDLVKLEIFPMIHPISGVRGFKVSRRGDEREAFVLEHRFMELFNRGPSAFFSELK
ncbi:MAG: DUF4340 domain-containing protein [Planctomycetota bacterium]